MNKYTVMHMIWGVIFTAGFIAMLVLHKNLGATGFVGMVAAANFVFAAIG